jgi:hypothetical protein
MADHFVAAQRSTGERENHFRDRRTSQRIPPPAADSPVVPNRPIGPDLRCNLLGRFPQPVANNFSRFARCALGSGEGSTG